MAAKAQSLYDKGTWASRRALLTSADDHKGIGSHLPPSSPSVHALLRQIDRCPPRCMSILTSHVLASDAGADRPPANLTRSGVARG